MGPSQGFPPPGSRPFGSLTLAALALPSKNNKATLVNTVHPHHRKQKTNAGSVAHHRASVYVSTSICQIMRARHERFARSGYRRTVRKALRKERKCTIHALIHPALLVMPFLLTSTDAVFLYLPTNHYHLRGLASTSSNRHWARAPQ